MRCSASSSVTCENQTPGSGLSHLSVQVLVETERERAAGPSRFKGLSVPYLGKHRAAHSGAPFMLLGLLALTTSIAPGTLAQWCLLPPSFWPANRRKTEDTLFLGEVRNVGKRCFLLAPSAFPHPHKCRGTVHF